MAHLENKKDQLWTKIDILYIPGHRHDKCIEQAASQYYIHRHLLDVRNCHCIDEQAQLDATECTSSAVVC